MSFSTFPTLPDVLDTSKTATSTYDPADHPTHHNTLAAAIMAVENYLIQQMRLGTGANGADRVGFRRVTASGTVRVTDGVVEADATAAAITLTLPSCSLASVALGLYRVIKVDSGTNHVTVQGTAGQLINGAATQVITSQWGVLRLYSDGTQWLLL